MMKASTLFVGSCRLMGPSLVSTRGCGLLNDWWSFHVDQMHAAVNFQPWRRQALWFARAEEFLSPNLRKAEKPRNRGVVPLGRFGLSATDLSHWQFGAQGLTGCFWFMSAAFETGGEDSLDFEFIILHLCVDNDHR